MDVLALQGFFDAQGLDRRGPLQVEQIAGGRSNLTYRLTDGHHSWVLRRPPRGGLTPSAHDMHREFRVVQALHGSRVPLARPVAYCEDISVIGGPFAVTEYVTGIVLRGQTDIAHLPQAELTAIAESLIEVMVDLHNIEPASVGLADFGRPNGYLRRQIARWTDQWPRVSTEHLPDVERLGVLLAENCPAESGVAIVHGDFRIDNAILDTDRHATIRALVDWEMATLGDPLADLALHMVYRDPIFAPVLGGDAASTDSRMPTAEHLAQHYAEKSGRDVDQLQFHLGLAYFKTAVVSEGIHARHRGGHTFGSGFDSVHDAVPALAAAGLAALGSHGISKGAG